MTKGMSGPRMSCVMTISAPDICQIEFRLIHIKSLDRTILR